VIVFPSRENDAVVGWDCLSDFFEVLMILAGLVAGRWSVAAERKPLEAVARPLTFIDIG
jgi:hypothetical protein